MATILTVDDSVLSRWMAAEPLRAAGHTVIEAADGRQGIAAYEGHSPDCIVTDLLMPEVDGYQLVRHIRNLDREVPVIVLTADIQASTVAACRKLGITAFLNKPVDPGQLTAAVEKALTQTGGVPSCP